MREQGEGTGERERYMSFFYICFVAVISSKMRSSNKREIVAMILQVTAAAWVIYMILSLAGDMLPRRVSCTLEEIEHFLTTELLESEPMSPERIAALNLSCESNMDRAISVYRDMIWYATGGLPFVLMVVGAAG